jgi:6-phospho-beta-glucosidase
VKLEELAFWDTDQERLKVMGRVTDAMGKRSGLRARIKTSSTVEGALEGADYVITSIRAGGIDARVKDESIALAHGLVGQETVGAGGLCLRDAEPRDYAGVCKTHRANCSSRDGR